MSTEITLHLTICIPDDYMVDGNWKDTRNYIKDSAQELAENLEGSIIDLEIK